MKRKVLLAAMVLALLFFGWVYRHTLVAPNDIQRTTGTVEATEVNISTKITGRITKLCCREGDTISKNQVVLELEHADLEADVAVAQAGVEKAKADVQVAEARVNTLRSGLAVAKTEIHTAEVEQRRATVLRNDSERKLQMAQRLYKQNSASRDALDDAITAHETAMVGEDVARAKLESATANQLAALAQLEMALSQAQSARTTVRQEEARLARQKTKVADSVVASPLSATVVYTALAEGEIITPGVSALTLADLSQLTVRVDIDETRLGGIRLGGPARIITMGKTRSVAEGTVRAINRYADFATQKDVTAGRQDIRTFRVTVAVANNSAEFSPGMTVVVEFPVRDHEGRN